MIGLNECFDALDGGYLFSEIADIKRKYINDHPAGRKLLDFGIGDTRGPIPSSAAEAIKRAAEDQTSEKTFRGYSPVSGYDFFSEAVSKRYERLGVRLERDEIFATDGAKTELFLLSVLLGKGTAIIPSPSYPAYADICKLCGRRVIYVKWDRIPAEEKNAVYFLCSPSNPTGLSLDKKDLEGWIDLAEKTGSVIIYDSAYEAFLPPKDLHSPYQIRGAENCVIEVCSFSKSAFFTGIRCGYTVIPRKMKELNAGYHRLKSTVQNGVSCLSQRGAEAVLSEKGEEECRLALEKILENRRIITYFLSEKGIEAKVLPSPYIFIKTPSGMSGKDLFRLLLERYQIVVTPGEGFGAENHIRISAFADRNVIKEAICRIKEG